MLRVVIIASGLEYQNAAALAAGTYVRFKGTHDLVEVQVPKGERISHLLRRFSREFAFSIVRFPLVIQTRDHFTSQLKCQGFLWRIRKALPNEIVLFADADTCCLKPIRLSRAAKRAIQSGRVGLVADIADRHFKEPSVPWYLSPDERCTYVNSGIMFAGSESLPLFECVQSLSKEPRFLVGAFNDQKVINYALGKRFPMRLMLLAAKLNSIARRRSDTIIAHFAEEPAI